QGLHHQADRLDLLDHHQSSPSKAPTPYASTGPITTGAPPYHQRIKQSSSASTGPWAPP
ncbi:unnamed protein product, partial [Adineta steineri]